MQTRTETWASPGAPGASAAEAEADRYEDLGPLAAGGMGEVRRVRDRRLDCVVARKQLAPDRASCPRARARFVAEATVTARLRHPGIVAVHDRGERADGTLWYTMTEVRGDTLGGRIAAERHLPDGVRRLATAVARVCEAIAFAHAQGVVHRDLKPDNVMLGPFGEVVVVDWGVAAAVGDAAAGVVGTPGWVAPEQARGAPPAPAADVYGLGGLLHAILSGAPPRTGPPGELWARVVADPPGVAPPGPAALASACAAAMDPDPAARPTAATLGERVLRYLLDAERTAEARALLARAGDDRAALDRARARAAALRARARDFLAGLSAYVDPAEKAPAWAWEDEARALERDLAERETAWLQRVGAALERDPELAEAHAALADHHAAALLLAEAEGRDADAVRAEGSLRRHDRGAHAALLRGDGRVRLASDPPGAVIRAFRSVERGRRRVLEPAGELGATPWEGTLPRGSWCFELHHPERSPVRVATFLERGRDDDGLAPGAREVHVHRLPRPGELGPAEVLVPAGWCRIGGDAAAIEPLPGQRIWLDAFVARVFPVTFAELRAFLQDVADRDPAGAIALGPRTRQHRWTRVEGGRVAFELPEGYTDRHPATAVDWHTATAFAAWEAERTGRGWRLPDEVEWEKAARGADGRRYVCGDHAEAVWFNVLGGGPTARVLEPIGQHPLDESVYGVRDLAGNAAEWCAGGWRDGPAADASGCLRGAPPGPFRVVRGGAYSKATTHLAQRHADPPDRAFPHLGFRLVRSCP